MLAKDSSSLVPRLLIGGWVMLGVLGLSHMFIGASSSNPAKMETALLATAPGAAPATSEVTELRRTVANLAARTAALDAKLAALEASLGPATAAIPLPPAGAKQRGAALNVKIGPLPSTGFGDADVAQSSVPIASGETTQTQFGVQIAVASDRGAIRSEWRNALSRHHETLAGLEARALASPSAAGEQSWALIAGPFGNVADAMKTCARLKANSVACRETIFAGDPIAVR